MSLRARSVWVAATAATRSRLWSLEDLNELKVLAGQGVAPAIIAARLRRTVSSVRNKAGMHGISLRPSAARVEAPPLNPAKR